MSTFNQYFSTLTITYLLEAFALRKVNVIDENELILNITSMVSIMGIKENIAIPSQNKHLYVEMLNKNSGTMMIVLDELVNANYIIRKKDNDNITYMVNFEHDYIKKFIASHGAALKYVSHPSYSLKRPLPNDENSLCSAIENMKISSTPTNSKTKSVNIEPQYKKKKVEEEDYEENTDLVTKLDKAFAKVEDLKEGHEDDSDTEEEVYYVKSETNSKVTYTVTNTSCTCSAFTYGKGKPCKHMNMNSNNFVKNKVIVKNQKEESKLDTSLLIKAVFSLQTESDLDKFYNICQHGNSTLNFTCTCASYKYQFAKTKGYCKHIQGFLTNYYQKYDTFTLVNHFCNNDNTPVLLQGANLNTFKNHFDQKLHNNELISNYVNSDTLYHGLYVWAFDDSLTDAKLEKESVLKQNKLYQQQNNHESSDESVGPEGTYDGLTDDD